MADEVQYVDVQPAPDSEITVSTGPMVPVDEVHKALGQGTEPAADDDAEDADEEKSDAKEGKSKKTSTTAGSK